MTQTMVLLNPHAAGGKAAALAGPMRRWLAQHAPQVDLSVPDTVAQARQLIDALPYSSRVVVVGGDGTVNQFLPSLLNGAHTTALVPYGSGNDTARALGLYGFSWQKALAHGLAGVPSQVDVGLAEFDAVANGHTETRSVPFISSFNIGFDASVGLRAINGPKGLPGLLRYLLATVRELVNFRTWQIQVQLDGALVYSGKALFASAFNTRTFGAGMPAVPPARIDDGLLNLLLAGDVSVVQAVLLLPRLLVGKHLSHPKVLTQPFQTMQIESVRPVPIAADGEYLGMSRKITVRVHEGQLAVVAATA
jgi:diacylglycerol kinase (ATP)